MPNGDVRTLKHRVALESPCATCATSPCCTHLPLTTFQVTNLLELDHALYLLNFDHIELGISASGEWSAYYTYPCRYLNRATFECSVHNTRQQPQICVHYNPYNCWYRRSFSDGQGEEFVRIDRARLSLLLDYIEFDQDRRITSVPDWDTLVEMMRRFADQPKPVAPVGSYGDAVFDEWAEMVTGDAKARAPGDPLSFDQLREPCDGCAAYCCTTLVFPQGVPTHVSNLDYYRFCLGFPGVELGVADGQWSVIVRTTCRHLQDGRCGVYGQEERPLLCKYYDAWKCDYKPQFGQARPTGFMRVRLEQWEWLAASLPYDEDGSILAIPPIEDLRLSVESQWKARGAVEIIPLMVME